MTFFRTEMLFFIWAVPVLFLVIVYGTRRRREIMHRFSSAHGLDVIAPDTVGSRRWVKASLLMGTVLFTAVALAGPRYGYRWQEIRQQGVDIIIALDCSRSMIAADIQPNRLERAKREVFDLLAMLKGDRVGLVAFAGTAFLQCPLTLDYDAFNLFLNSLSPDYLPVGGTDITRALATALDSFDPKSASDKAVILITDGENTGGGQPLKAAETLKENKIKLFCIGVGSSDGVPIPEPDGGFKKDRSGQIVLSRLDENTLKKMAVVTGGTYVRSVAGDMDLDAIYTDEIRRTMEAKTVSSGRKQVWEDRFQWPLALALLCLAIELMLPVARKTLLVSLLAMLILGLQQPAEASDTRDGIAAYEKGDFEQALKHFTDAQLNAPDKPETLYNVADGYYKTGNFDAAAEHYKQALETDDTQLKRRALYNLGNAEFRRGRAKEAIGHYKAALAIDPDDRQTQENLAFVKKIMEQQQQQSGDDRKNQDKKDQGQENETQPKEDGDAQSTEDQEQDGARENRPDGEQQQQRPEFGDEMDEQQKQKQARADKPQNNGQQPAQPQSAQPGEAAGDPEQAERMLNRLEDQPGRALMPATGRRTVEKDW
ncbi:VWA domain-containing protein [Desulfosarcina sp.]|uniref:VWA domain-containing protein n=1 Tax=Desulfosarcina sp. TaxID=2027861 RepID=UPI0029A3C923|nr:VWA domain-containing protein [Desulfosarcina sp.]MDX2452829.1 VWA domain-containing protein [Desulfosarcina sp.]MDX2490573.1 VWA domain-containing protein [Desulfosarcina sp.]